MHDKLFLVFFQLNPGCFSMLLAVDQEGAMLNKVGLPLAAFELSSIPVRFEELTAAAAAAAAL